MKLLKKNNCNNSVEFIKQETNPDGQGGELKARKKASVKFVMNTFLREPAASETDE